VSIRVLVAHGNTQRLKNAVAELHAAGFEVSATPDGGDAFARFFEERPDIVICSMQLPSLAGSNIARMVHSQSPDTTVVLLTDGEKEPPPEGVVTLADPLSLVALREALPQFAFDTLEPPEPVADATPSTPVKVFVQAVLKRYQRDNRALSVLDEQGIARMAAVAENRSFESGALLIRQGDDGDGFYLVVEGQVRVTLAEKGNKEVARIEAGGFFGEMSLLSDQKRSASVWTVGPSTLLWFDKQKFLPLLHDYPTMREVLSGVALKRTEENLWRVLFDDEEVQRSLAQLDLGGPKPAAEIEIDIDEGEVTQPIAAARVPVVAEPRDGSRFLLGAAVGFAAGVLLMWIARPAPHPVPAVTTVVAAKPRAASLPVVALPAPASEPIHVAEPEEAVAPPVAKAEHAPGRDEILSAAKSGNWRVALTRVKKYKSPVPDPEIAFIGAEAQRQAGSADDALIAYLDFIKTFPSDGRTDDAQFWAAEIYRQQGKADLAKALYEQVAATVGSNFRTSAQKHLK
jgi:CRP-like cAMP-binding protein